MWQRVFELCVRRLESTVLKWCNTVSLNTGLKTMDVRLKRCSWNSYTLPLTIKTRFTMDPKYIWVHIGFICVLFFTWSKPLEGKQTFIKTRLSCIICSYFITGNTMFLVSKCNSKSLANEDAALGQSKTISYGFFLFRELFDSTFN